MQKFIIALLFFIFSSLTLQGQQITKSTYGDVLLQNATVHTITKGTLSNTDVLIADGMIKGVGSNLTSDAIVVDCEGKHIYPGFIDAGTKLGMSEVSSVSLTNDFDEIGSIIPQMNALTAVNPNAVAIPVTRVNGVTSALAVPTGGLFPGTAGLINLHGYTPDQMSAGFQAVVFNFPSSGKKGRRDKRSEEDIKKDREKSLKKIIEVWEELALYHLIDSAAIATNSVIGTYQPEMAALLPVYRKEAPLLVNVNKKEDILEAIKWIDKVGIKAILVGVSEGYKVADEIGKAKLPVIIGPMLSIPSRASDHYDISYRAPSILQKAGVLVALRTDDSENVRNLPFNAGFAATYGMGVEEALKAITINPAKMMGVDDKYGSIEEGKVANLFVADGDPFEMKTRLSHLFINGWNVPIESRHTLLYNEFLDRSPGLKE
ncbi:MAG: imidazolonepropionase-like amidohydrolase [Saprospiraceae bacterium]|jgi:imidazolonepropionase-like amidohydrolase